MHSAPVPSRALRNAWILVALWIGVIVLETLIGSAENTGRLLRPLLEWLLGPLSLAQFFAIHFVIRKIGHLTGYAILGLLAFRAWWVTLRVRQTSSAAEALSWRAMLCRWKLSAAAYAVLVVAFVAALDEFHQSFDAARGGSPRDVLLDTMGGIAAQLALLLASELAMALAKWRASRRPQLLALNLQDNR